VSKSSASAPNMKRHVARQSTICPSDLMFLHESVIAIYNANTQAIANIPTVKVRYLVSFPCHLLALSDI